MKSSKELVLEVWKKITKEENKIVWSKTRKELGKTQCKNCTKELLQESKEENEQGTMKESMQGT